MEEEEVDQDVGSPVHSQQGPTPTLDYRLEQASPTEELRRWCCRSSLSLTHCGGQLSMTLEV